MHVFGRSIDGSARRFPFSSSRAAHRPSAYCLLLYSAVPRRQAAGANQVNYIVGRHLFTPRVTVATMSKHVVAGCVTERRIGSFAFLHATSSDAHFCLAFQFVYIPTRRVRVCISKYSSTLSKQIISKDMEFSENTQRYGPKIIYGTGQIATVNDEKFFVDLHHEHHHAAGVHGPLDKYGSVLIMILEDPETLTMIEGVSFDPTQPCTFSSSALGFPIQEMGSKAWADINGSRRQIGYPNDQDQCQLKIEFLLPPLKRMITIRPRPVDVPEELRSRLFERSAGHKENDDEVVKVSGRPIARARRHSGPDRADHHESTWRREQQSVSVHQRIGYDEPQQRKLTSVIRPARFNPMGGLDLEEDFNRARQRPAKRSRSTEREAPPKRQSALRLKKLSGSTSGPVSTIYDRSEGISPLFSAGRILDQLRSDARDLAKDVNTLELAVGLDEGLVYQSSFETAAELHVAVGHAPPSVTEPHLSGDRRIQVPGPACGSCSDLPDHPKPLRDRDRAFQARAVRNGAVISASVIEDAVGYARTAVYQDESSTYMISQTLRAGRQMEDYLVGLKRMVNLIRAGPCKAPAIIGVRSTMYTRSGMVREFMRENDLELVSDGLAPFVVLPDDSSCGLLEFFRHRRMRLRMAGLDTEDEYLEYEVSYLVHQHNVASYAGQESATLRLLGRVDDRLFVGYREEVEAKIDGQVRRAEFLSYAEKDFAYIVVRGGRAYVVTEIRPISE